MKGLLEGAALAAATMLSLSLSAPSFAAITGTVYLEDPTSTDASIIPSNSLAHAEFTTNAINFNTNSSPSTSIADFLNNPVFTNLQNGFDPTGETNNAFLLIKGSAFLNSGMNSFVVGHDDGVVISFPGLSASPVVNAPGPTGLDLTPFNVNNPGAAGLFSFTLQYAECCGGPADLDFTINGAPPVAAPEPAIWAMMVTGFGVVGGTMRTRRRTAVAYA
jgi:hypothetical protein